MKITLCKIAALLSLSMLISCGGGGGGTSADETQITTPSATKLRIMGNVSMSLISDTPIDISDEDALLNLLTSDALVIDSTALYAYDSNHNKANVTYYDADDTIFSESNYVYVFNGDTPVTRYESRDRNDRTWEYETSWSDNLIASSAYEETNVSEAVYGENVYAYNSNNQRITSDRVNSSSLTSIHRDYMYNANGQLATQERIVDAVLSTAYHYEYDNKGNVSTRVVERYSDGTLNSTELSVFVYEAENNALVEMSFDMNDFNHNNVYDVDFNVTLYEETSSCGNYYLAESKVLPVEYAAQCITTATY